MAKIMISIDTEESTVEATVNGELVPNVTEVHCYQYKDYEDGEYYYDCRIVTMEETEDVKKMSTIMAAEHPSHPHVTFESVGKNKAVADIQKFFKGGFNAKR